MIVPSKSNDSLSIGAAANLSHRRSRAGLGQLICQLLLLVMAMTSAGIALADSSRDALIAKILTGGRSEQLPPGSTGDTPRHGAPTLPAGFKSIPVVTAPKTGRVWIKRTPRGNAAGKPQSGGALAELASTLRGLAPHFGQSFEVGQAIRDDNDAMAQSTFKGQYAGVAVAGMALASADSNGVTIGLVFDHAQQIGKTFKPLMALLGQATRNTGGAAAGGRVQSIDPKTVKWVPHRAGDQTVSVMLPQGYRTTMNGGGTVMALGPEGESIYLGTATNAYTPEVAAQYQRLGAAGSQQLRGWFVAPFGKPSTTFAAFHHWLEKRATEMNPQRKQGRLLKILHVKDMPTQQQNIHAQYIVCDFISGDDGKVHRGYNLVINSMGYSGIWTVYVSGVSAPRKDFDRKFDVFMKIWESRKVNQAAVRKQIEPTLRALREIRAIQRKMWDDYHRSRDDAMWDVVEVLRERYIVEDKDSGGRVWLDHVDPRGVIDKMNEAEGRDRYKLVPTKQWWRERHP